MPEPDRHLGPGSINPAALALADVARLLTRIGGESISESMIQADVDAGAPTNKDGSLNLVHYCAWLIKHLVEIDRGS